VVAARIFEERDDMRHLAVMLFADGAAAEGAYAMGWPLAMPAVHDPSLVPSQGRYLGMRSILWEGQPSQALPSPKWKLVGLGMFFWESLAPGPFQA
jgi:hypothetical protein